jgi:glycine cleavage system aminomethyltransferase T
MHEGTDPMVEYDAIRTGTGIWDLFSTSKYEVTGPTPAGDPAPVHELARRHAGRPGAIRRFVNADGKMIDDGNVYKHADDKYWVMINTPDIQIGSRRPPAVSTRRWPTAPRTSG